MTKFKKLLLLLLGYQLVVISLIGIINRFFVLKSGQISIAVLAIAGALLVLVPLWCKGSSFGKCEVMLGLLLSMSLAMNISIFGPVFVDRSISYHIVMSAASGDKSTTENLYRTCELQVDKRVTELQALGLINESQIGVIETTNAGSFVSNIWEAVGRFTNTLDEWIRFRSKLQ